MHTRTLLLVSALAILSEAMVAALGGCAAPRQRAARRDGSLAVEASVKTLLAKMTIEEKVGQMAQITVGVVSKSEGKAPLVLDVKKLEDAVVAYHVGSILNCDNVAVSARNWNKVITTIQDVATKKTRLGIPVLYGIDAIHGANYTQGATIFPHNIAMAATRNVELVRRSGEVTAQEVRASGIPWNFNPVLGLARQPLWPRCFETYGEDPYLASVLGSAYIRGLQGDDIGDPRRVAACMKHYLGYSVPVSGKDRTPAMIPERSLRDLYLKPFAAAVDAGVATVMVNSSEINGVPVHSSKFYLTDILRNELGFDGFVVTDWEDIANLAKRERVAKNERDAIRQAVLAGIDMSMIPYDYKGFCTKLLDLVQKGEVPESRIDEAVGNILRVKFRLGLFEKPYPDPDAASGIAAPEATALNLQAAREAVTLLKNTKELLPLARGTKVLVAGPAADKLSCLCGGWTITWQGDKEELYPAEKQTILEAVRAAAGEDNVTYVEGVSFKEERDIDKAVDAARHAGVAILCLGEATYCEGFGDINDLTLSAPQLELARRVGKTGTPVVLVLVEGRPRVIGSIEGIAGAILTAYLPGLEGGRAVADVLFGNVNPSGKLPFTYPRHPCGFTTYDRRQSEESGQAVFEPQWPFGHGLSYTTFTISNLHLDAEQVRHPGTLTATVDVRNTGRRRGAEVVQLYVRDPVASVTRPVRQLKAFRRIELDPGEERGVVFRLNTGDLKFHDRAMNCIVQPGRYHLWVGASSTGGLEGSFTVEE